MKFNKLLFLIIVFLTLIISLNSINVHAQTCDISNKILDPHVRGDVYLNPLIQTYLTKNSLNEQRNIKYISGSRVYCLGNGKGKKILICGGIHGDEVQGSLSVLEFLYYIQRKEPTGTLYIIPFAIPVDTEKNTRTYNDSGLVYDPNRKANINGTPVNKILKFAVSHKVKYIIDVHSGTGVSKNGMVYYQTNFEKNWAAFIKQKTKSTLKTNPQKGTLRSEARAKKINAIVLEVEKKSQGVDLPVQKELDMIKRAYTYLMMIK
ncbi:succinylglutamate desuccinylase/aspartoacylase domain-containing protein [Methanobacterium alcaliphilum]|uniref:succinylglutamate desuccinylase/aspartoacylase domain-containing protein n=1 Tax=Methanobacterium alcaliphilum TaxID=392018 RepID=UPI00200A0188|nr:succinylglutamate desuccinylase/aspartoacylase family protein [Methanobacterium alcaliphilum]MCK9151995.1 succinylglutamate desuccinylase/aspartoacylase family protein [Methanobacterium alcaliphilum]